jgi:hypothetical protein
MHSCLNGTLAFYSLRWRSSKITLYMSWNTVTSNVGYGQWPKHVGVHYSRIPVQSVGDELVYVYHLHGKCAVLRIKLVVCNSVLIQIMKSTSCEAWLPSSPENVKYPRPHQKTTSVVVILVSLRSLLDSNIFLEPFDYRGGKLKKRHNTEKPDFCLSWLPILMIENAPLFAMKAKRENGGIAQLILNHATRWRSVVTPTPRPLYPREKGPHYPTNWWLGWAPQLI